MGLKRCQFFFEDSSDHGWSETHFLPPSVTLEGAFAAFDTLKTLRQNLLGSSAYLLYMRVSDDNVRGDSLVKTFRDHGSSGGSTGEGPADIGFNALLCRLQSVQQVIPPLPDPPYTVVKRGMTYLRGVDDALCRAGGTFRPTGQFNRDFREFSEQLVTRGFGLRNIGNNSTFPLISVAQVPATGLVTVSCANLLSIGGNDSDGRPLPNLVNITNLPRNQGFGGLRGIHSCVGPAVFDAGPPAHTTVQFYSKRVIPNWVAGGLISAPRVNFNPITGIEAERFVERKAGRAFGVPVGRRTVR
jgi:hypothetical protein